MCVFERGKEKEGGKEEKGEEREWGREGEGRSSCFQVMD